MTQPPYGQQPPYGEPERPPYGQPERPYGQPPHYSPAAEAYGDPVGSGAKFGVPGATWAGVGIVLTIVGFTALDWLKNGLTFSDLHNIADRTSAPGLTDAYFSYLGWLLAILTFLIAIAANLPSPASGPLRALGGVLAVASIVITLFALKANGSFGDMFKDARAGFYLAIAGFLAMGIGALLGPTRVVRRYPYQP